MRNTDYRYRAIISVAVALFFALSPLIHGLHLAFSTHSRGQCSVCFNNSMSPSHDGFDCCYDSAISLSSFHDEEYPKGHDPNTCPLCRQFSQLLQIQFVLSSPVLITLQDSLPQEPIIFSGDFVNISFNSIIPRAPPVC